MADSGETFRFRDFELDVAAYELRRNGRPIRLERQPMDVLILLVERRGLLVSRSDIVDRLWGKDVFVDVETGVHTAIRKIRQALRDSREEPVFVETISGKGYRFIADVEVLAATRASTSRGTHTAPPPASEPELSHVVTTAGPSERELREPSPVPEAATRARNALRVRLALGALSIAMVAAFLTWTRLGGGASGSRITLAVLPFDNLTGDPEREYLAGGLTEETSASLGQIDQERLTVKGRTLRYKGTTKTVAEIGRELDVDYLVESSIRAEGDRLRVTAKLIRVRDQEHVWSQSFERAPASMLGLQQELSTAIAEQIRLRLSPARLSGRQTRNADAYDAYLKARHLEDRRNPESTKRAVQYYEQAIALDPNYALAWSGLAQTTAASAMNSDARALEVWPHAREAAARAIRGNPDLAEAQCASGQVNWLFDWDWRSAEAAFRRAISFDPSNATAHRFLGHLLSQMGRHREAELSMRRARELEPLSAIAHALSSQVAFQARDYASAAGLARQTIAMDSELWIGYIELAQVYEQLGKTDLALATLIDAERFSGGNSKAISLKGYVLAKMGRISEAREVLKTLDGLPRERHVPPFSKALVHAGLGERDLVFAWLDKAYDARDVHLMFLPVDPKWDPYRADPRFQALLARCRFATGE